MGASLRRWYWNRGLNEGKEHVLWTSEGLQVGDQQGGRPSWRKVVGKFKKQQKDHVAGENLGQRHGYLASKTAGGQGGDVNFDTVGQGALEG